MTHPPSHQITQATLRRILTLATLALLSATLAQPAPASAKPPAASSLVDSLHYRDAKFTNWDPLAQINPSGKLFVVTLADPTHRHTCRIQSFTADQLTCKGLGARTYPAQDIAALIVPGDYNPKRWLVLGFNAAAGAAIWGTIVLAPVCVPCAVATGVAAGYLLGGAGATLICDNLPDRLLYLTPGQTLQVKLRY